MTKQMVEVHGLRFCRTDFGDDPAHVEVQVRGHGRDGMRPLVGRLTMSPAEWHEFARKGGASDG